MIPNIYVLSSFMMNRIYQQFLCTLTIVINTNTTKITSNFFVWVLQKNSFPSSFRNCHIFRFSTWQKNRQLFFYFPKIYVSFTIWIQNQNNVTFNLWALLSSSIKLTNDVKRRAGISVLRMESNTEFSIKH